MAENMLKYKLRVLSGARWSNFMIAIDRAQEVCHWSRLKIAADMVRCHFKYGSGYNDYSIFHFYELTDKQKDTYLNRYRNKLFVTQMNDENYAHFFDNKNEFYHKFRDYLGRDFVDLETDSKEDAIKFFETHDRIFCKIKDGSCADGAELLYTKDFEDGEAFYKYVMSKNLCVLEDVLENHPAIKEIYPYALNCLRVVTLIGDDGKPHILGAFEKFGREGRFVDVFGIHGPVNLKTGKLDYPLHRGDTLTNGLFYEHPDTHKQLVGFEIPFFKETMQCALRAAMVVPQMRYIGWDIAVTPNGPAIIEGNHYSSMDYFQLPGQSDKKIGLIPRIKKFCPSFQYK